MSKLFNKWPGGTFFLIVLIMVFGGVAARVGYLQIYKADEFRKQALHQQRKIVPQSAQRGLIVDRCGRVLAISVKVPSVWADPGFITDKPNCAHKLSVLLGIPADDVYKKLTKRKGSRFVWIKRYISSADARKVRDARLRGVGIRREYQRKYPQGQLAAHVLGYTDIDGKGLAGVEAYYDDYLRARPGKIIFKKDVRRRSVALEARPTESKPGDTLVLSLDAVIQQCVEEQLKAVVKKFHAEGASAIVMNPQSGEVLALANYPAFDPAHARQSKQSLRRNRVITDPFEPGSTFKPFTVAAAMAGHFIRLSDKIDCLKHPFSAKGLGTIHEYDHYYGVISVKDILVHSSNIGAAKLALKMGKAYFFKMIQKFGFGRKTGIDLPGEGKGILVPITNDQWKWGNYALTRAAYGQGPIAVTCVQLLRGFCCLANGGRLVKPRLANGIIDSRGKIVKDFSACQVSLWQNDPRAGSDGAGRIIPEKVANNLISKALVDVVENKHGTGHRAKLDNYYVFGKTGTARIARKDGPGYEPNKWISSFIAGAPLKNPQLCVLVQVRAPDRSLGLGYTGGAVASPVVKNILQYSLKYLGVPPDKNTKKQ